MKKYAISSVLTCFVLTVIYSYPFQVVRCLGGVVLLAIGIYLLLDLPQHKEDDSMPSKP